MGKARMTVMKAGVALLAMWLVVMTVWWVKAGGKLTKRERPAHDHPPHAEIRIPLESEAALRVRIHHEHVPGMANLSSLGEKRRTWETVTFTKPYREKERTQPCPFSATATSLNVEAVELIRAALANQHDYPPSFTTAKDLLRKAVRQDKSCHTPRFNLFLVLMGESMQHNLDRDVSERLLKEAKALLSISEDDMKNIGKYWFWVCIFTELETNGTSNAASASYRKAILLDPGLEMQHIHPDRRYMQSVLGGSAKKGDYYIRRALVQLLFYYEYGPSVGGHTPVTYEDAHHFARDWHIALDNALPPYCFMVVSFLYRFLVDENMLGWNGKGYRGAATHESNSDAVNSWNNVQIKSVIERLTAIEVIPTYGYQAGYIAGDVLRPHTDRASCEFTMTTLINAYPHVSNCPLFVQKTPWKISKEWVGRYEENTIDYNDSINLHPQLNQWMIIRGRAKPHYRPPLPLHTTCTTLLAHYIPTQY